MNQQQAEAAGYRYHGTSVSALDYDWKYEDGRVNLDKEHIDTTIAEIKAKGYKAIKVRGTASECGGRSYVSVYVEKKYFIDEAIADVKARIAALPAQLEAEIAKARAKHDSALSELLYQLERLILSLHC